MIKILPVIHYLDDATAIKQAKGAYGAGADGVFLISHTGQSSMLPNIGGEIQDLALPNFKVGVNFLGWDPLDAYKTAEESGMDMLWLDAPGLSSRGLSADGIRLMEYIRAHSLDTVEVFASVAFKYQPPEAIPSAAAALARNLGLIPTTSGPATGVPPDLQKVVDMHGGTGPLAIASGMTADNVATFAPHLSHILVATGVSIDDHHFDYELLQVFIARARGAA